jgi:hypothetical protein
MKYLHKNLEKRKIWSETENTYQIENKGKSWFFGKNQ